MQLNPVLRSFPADDDGFAEQVRRAVVEAGERAAARDDAIALAEAILRTRYPSVVIRAMSELAHICRHEPPTWYVFRDGTLAVAAREASTGADGAAGVRTQRDPAPRARMDTREDDQAARTGPQRGR